MLTYTFSVRLAWFTILTFNLLGNLSCNEATSAQKISRSSHFPGSQNRVFTDGRYCASVEYMNEQSGKTIEDIVPVEIVDDALVKIIWADEKDGPSFDAVHINDSAASFLSRKRINFKIKILGQQPDCMNYAANGKFSKEQICPVCGHRKNAADDLCGDCNDEIANTCYNCSAYSLNVNGGLCDDCKIRICPICSGKKISSTTFVRIATTELN